MLLIFNVKKIKILLNHFYRFSKGRKEGRGKKEGGRKGGRKKRKKKINYPQNETCCKWIEKNKIWKSPISPLSLVKDFQKPSLTRSVYYVGLLDMHSVFVLFVYCHSYCGYNNWRCALCIWLSSSSGRF